MKRSWFSEEQMASILREQEVGATTADVCRKHGISSATYNTWKAKLGGLGVSVGVPDVGDLRGVGHRVIQLEADIDAAVAGA